MSLLQRILGRLPTAVEDFPLPSGALAHPPGGAQLAEHQSWAEPLARARDDHTIRFVSWNIHYGYGPVMHHGRGLSRGEVIGNLNGIADLIREWEPDIVALQEVDRGALRSHHIDQLEWLAQHTGLRYSAWCPTWDAGWVPYPGSNPANQIGRVFSGQAVLSRHPIAQARRHALPQPTSRTTLTNLFYLHRALLEVKVSLPSVLGGSIQVFNAHLEAFDAVNRQAHAEITSAQVRRAGDRVVLLGDMNSVPPEAKIRHAFEDEPQTDMREDRTIEILRSTPGLHEVAGQASTSTDERLWHSFPAHAPNRRLDYLFHGEALQVKGSRVTQPSPPVSDHLPLVADLEPRVLSAN
jgi:endonuclease/exonuclease/phosphatase family metal-dependent hydrolase